MNLSLERGLPMQAVPSTWVINARTLIAFRWAAVLAQSVTIAVAHFQLDLALELWPLAVVIAVEVMINLASLALLRRGTSGEPWLVGGMLLDLGALTAVLMLTGGPLNPFSSLYIVYIALSALILRPGWTWALGTISMLCFASLFLVYPDTHGEHAQHKPHDMALHLRGMWVALALTAAVITLFVGRLARQLASAREQIYRGEKLGALATLAAGAAHELSTPLSTIAVLSKDIEHEARQSDLHHLVEDARVMREQVARCRLILEQLAADAGQPCGEAAVACTLRRLVDGALAPLEAARLLTVAFEGGAAERIVVVPERIFGHALRALVKNALQAVDADGHVHLQVRASADRLVCEVVDDGTGMSEHTRRQATDPFFTTRTGGDGMGLGLFLATSVVEILGGELTLGPVEPRGTRATLEVPLAVPRD
jgi:two-component system, sensor histidine kinase RegB